MTHRLHALALVALIATAACDDLGTRATDREPPVPGLAPGHKLLGTITCHVDVAAQAQKCGDMVPPGGPSNARVIYGGSYFTLVTTTSFHNPTLQTDNLFNKIQNNLGQDIGTHNGIQSDSIRAFLTNWAATGGTGSVEPNNHDGVGIFTAANQPYWEYREIVPANGGQSSTLIWIFDVPNTVTSWTYTVALSAPIAHPNGWIEVTGDEQIPLSGSRQHTAVARDWTGAVDNAGTVSWSRTNVSGSVTVTPNTARIATIAGGALGTAEITASKGSATPAVYGVEVVP
jgi:hypothetical protein